MATTNSTSYPIATETFGTTSPVTGSAPSADTDGLPTDGLALVTVFCSVASGVTLSGAGSLLAYEYSPTLARWARNPGADFTISTSGVRDLEAGVVTVAPFRPSGSASPTRLKYIPSGVTFSAGSAGVTLTFVGTKAVIAGRGTA